LRHANTRGDRYTNGALMPPLLRQDTMQISFVNTGNPNRYQRAHRQTCKCKRVSSKRVFSKRVLCKRVLCKRVLCKRVLCKRVSKKSRLLVRLSRLVDGMVARRMGPLARCHCAPLGSNCHFADSCGVLDVKGGRAAATAQGRCAGQCSCESLAS